MMISKFLRAVAVASFAGSTLLASLPTARAHGDLLSAEPAVNATVTSSPSRLRLAFDEALVSVGTKVTLFDAVGKQIALPKGQIDPVDPKAFIVDVPVALSNGTHTVRWTVVSTDGHAEKGSYAFKVKLSAVAATSPADVALRFALRAGTSPVTCAAEVKNLGGKKTSARLLDARMHISNVRLIDAAGKETAVALANDAKWQDGRVALLDFENGTGLCREGGNADLRDIVLGKAPAGAYTGLAFDVGVPQEMNHADVATAKSPLNVSAMWWNWQNGYKFLRLDLKTAKDAFLIHLGSTGCGESVAALDEKTSAGSSMTATMALSDTAAMTATMAMSGTKTSGEGMAMDMSAGNKPPAKPCANPNRISVKLVKFNAGTDIVVADLDQLLRGVDISAPTPQPSGCMSGVSDTDCSPLFANMGLAIKTGACEKACAGQRFFRVEPAQRR